MVEFNLSRTDWDSYNWLHLIIAGAADGWACGIGDGENEWPVLGSPLKLLDVYQACVFERELTGPGSFKYGGFRVHETDDGILLEHVNFDGLQIVTSYTELQEALEDLFAELFDLMDQNSNPPGPVRDDALGYLDTIYDFDVRGLYERLTNRPSNT